MNGSNGISCGCTTPCPCDAVESGARRPGRSAACECGPGCTCAPACDCAR